MLGFTFLALAGFLASFTSAQNSSGSYPYTIDPGSVDFPTRSTWCMAQSNSCSQICTNGAFPNNCDPNTLVYQCTCSGGTTPNITQYKQTIPFFECQTYQQQCVNRTDNAQAQKACNNIPCGNMDPSLAASSASASMSMPSPTATGGGSSSTGSSSGGESSSSPSAAASQGAAVPMGSSSYGSSALAIGILAFFGLGF